MCPGYQDEAALFFRRYCGEGDDRSPPERTREPFESRIQCLTPSPESLQQCAFDDSEFEQRALAAFIDDYCIVSTNESLSRGYLHGLESLLTDAGPSSDIAKAARIAAFASLGNKTGDPDIGHRASELYLDLLHSFQITMSMAATSNTVESLTTAVLLGLYEVCHKELRIQDCIAECNATSRSFPQPKVTPVNTAPTSEACQPFSQIQISSSADTRQNGSSMRQTRLCSETLREVR